MIVLPAIRENADKDGNRAVMPYTLFDDDRDVHKYAQEYADRLLVGNYIYIDRNCIICPTLYYFIYDDEYFKQNRDKLRFLTRSK